MRTYTCICGGKLHYDDTSCDNCGRTTGFCPACRTIAPLIVREDGSCKCERPECGADLTQCYNYRVEHVCNRCMLAPPPGETPRETLCDCCRYNHTIPNLSVEGNREKWARLETAKRYLFYELDLVGLPRGNAADGFNPPLAFEFKQQYPMSLNADGTMSVDAVADELVHTGHLHGKITINIQEADPVERERLRVEFQEHNRTLIGHFRHEIAHYYWDLLIRGRREDAFRSVFGDYAAGNYAEALDRYHTQGPPDDWPTNYVSAYASMHPWEDFAETFATYLEIVSVLDTAHHMGLEGGGVDDDLDAMIQRFRPLGEALNLISRTMGLRDLSGRNLARRVIEKLRYVHELVQDVRSEPSQFLAPGAWPSSAASPTNQRA